MTTTDKFNGVSFQFEELIKVLETKNLSRLAWQLVANVIKYLWQPSLESSIELQSHLVDELQSLTARLIDEKGENDEIVLISRRIQLATFRVLNRYDEVEMLQRLEPKESLLTLASLAEDILAQNNPDRRAEVVGLYRRALALGFQDLTRTIWPSNVRAEIGAVYVSLAKVLINCGALEEAMTEINNLIAFSDKGVAEVNGSAALTNALFDAFKLMVDTSCSQSRQGNWQSCTQVMVLVAKLAFSILTEDACDEKMRQEVVMLNYGAVEAWHALMRQAIK